jgi:RNA polymerase sigma-70 factor (ECF subfamily)
MYLFVLNLITDAPEGADTAGPDDGAAGASASDESQVQRLVALARDGDARAARRLYQRFAGRLYRTVLPLAGSAADAEDVVQDAFVSALGSLHRYEQRPGTRFVAWLATIALNTARKQSRRTQRWRPLAPPRLDALQEERAARGGGDRPGATAPHHASAPHQDALAEGLDRKRATAALLEALAELPERERRIVVLRYGAELSATEIAPLVDARPAAVRKICQRQRERLLQRLTRAGLAPPGSGPRGPLRSPPEAGDSDEAGAPGASVSPGAPGAPGTPGSPEEVI